MSRRLSRALVYVGTVAVVGALSKLHASRVAEPPYDLTGSDRFAWAVAYTALLAVSAYGFGIPDVPRTLRSAEWSVLGATGTAALAISAAQLVLGTALLPRFVVFGSALVLCLWYLACVAVAAGGRMRAVDRDQVVLVAEVDEAAALDEDLRRFPERHAQVVGVLAAGEAASTGSGTRPLTALAHRVGASVVVLDRLAQEDESVVAQAAALHEQGIRVRTLSLFYEQWLGKLPLGELERTSLLFDIRELHGPRFARVKRLTDVVLAVPGCLVLGLAIPFVALGNLAGNRGSLFFRQVRTGRGGEPFEIVKFRTMRHDGQGGDDPAADGDRGAWTVEGDPRVTRFGRLLRISHLDELPQMVNILRGDLSFVGPRPEQPVYVAELVQKLPFYDLRHLVRPGLTGWAQVKYGYAASDLDAMHKLQYEFYYLRHQSLALDLRILGRTVRSVLGREGR